MVSALQENISSFIERKQYMRGKLKTWPLSLHGPETEKVSPFPFSQSVYLLVMCIGQHGHSLGCRVGAALEVGGATAETEGQPQWGPRQHQPRPQQDLRLRLLPAPESASPMPWAGELVRGRTQPQGGGRERTWASFWVLDATPALARLPLRVSPTDQFQGGQPGPGAWPPAMPVPQQARPGSLE